MRKNQARRGGLLLAVWLCALMAGQAGAQSFRDQAMMAKLLLKYREFKAITQNVRGKMNVNVDGATISADVEATLQMAQPNRFRIQTKVTFFGKEKSGSVISDGKTVWEWNADGKQYSELPLAPIAKNADKFTDWLMARTNADLTPVLFFEGASGKMFGLTPQAAKSIEVKDYPTKRIDGRALYIIPVPINEPDGTKGQATLYVDPETMLVQRCRFQIKPPREKNGPKNLSVDFVLNYEKIETAPTLAANAFTFTPPDGAKKVKMVKPVFDRAFD